MNKDSVILIVGHNDILEKSLFQYFEGEGYTNIFSSSLIGLNTTIQSSVYEFFQKYRPEYIFLGSTRSGGIEANKNNPGEFLYHNAESQNNIIYAAHKFGIKKLLYFASSCVYPKICPQPMAPEHLLTGPLEVTNEAYSIAKIAGIKLCQSYRKQYGLNAICAIPATLYGPASDKELATAHVMGALIGKFQEAVENKKEEVSVWGSGNPRREFIYINDFIAASLWLMKNYDSDEIIHIGVSEDVSIKELAQMIAEVIGFEGRIIFDTSKPDGTMQKLLDSSVIQELGWKVKITLREGIKKTLHAYQAV